MKISGQIFPLHIHVSGNTYQTSVINTIRQLQETTEDGMLRETLST